MLDTVMTPMTTAYSVRCIVGTPVSLRLPRKIEEQVRHLAAIEHRSIADMVRVLTEEAIKAREFPGIYFVNGPTGRRARLPGGPDIWEIIEPYLLAGRDWDALRRSYPDLPEGLLRTALRYFEKYPDEIESRVALNQSG